MTTRATPPTAAQIAAARWHVTAAERRLVATVAARLADRIADRFDAALDLGPELRRAFRQTLGRDAAAVVLDVLAQVGATRAARRRPRQPAPKRRRP
jgi:hypothetical protein